jgi:hypothetical protein
MEWKKISLMIFAAIWTVIFFVSWSLFYSFSTTAGKHTVMMRWPASEALPLLHDKPNILIFLHPKCSCSVASIAEFRRLVDSLSGRVHVRAILMKYQQVRSKEIPEGFASLFEIPEIKISRDDDGIISKSLGALTSGIVYLIDEEGLVVYQGGLTASRGHGGITAGSEFIRAWVTKRDDKTFMQKVFGCHL